MSRFACGRTRRLISRAMDAGDGPAALSAPDSRALAAHLETCPACRQMQETFTAQSAALRGAVPRTPPFAFTGSPASRALTQWETEKAATEPAPARSPARSSRRPATLLALTTATAAAASCAALILYVRTPHNATERKAGVTPAVQTNAPLPQTPFAPPQFAQATAKRGAPDNVAAMGTAFAAAAPPRTVVNPGGIKTVPARLPAATTMTPPRPAAMGDDLAYVNGDPRRFARRWTNLPPDATEVLEAHLRDSIKGGDSFVEVPLPRLASTSAGTAAAAVAAYRQERAVIDARLQRKVNVAVKGTAFSDLCAQISRDSGITFTAGRSVADDKITLFCKERSLRDLMRAISSVWGFTWERFGEEGAYRYRLTQPLRAQLLEEELRNRDKNEALIALDKAMDRYRQYLNLSPEQAAAMAKDATGEDKKLLESLGGSGWGPARLYFGLSPDEMAALRSGEPLRYGTSPASASPSEQGRFGQQMLPAELAGPILQAQGGNTRIEMKPDGDFSLRVGPDALKQKGLPPAEVPGANAVAQLRLNRNELGQFSLFGFSGVALDNGKSKGMTLFGDEMASGISPSVRDPKNAEANAALAGEPDLREKVTLPAAAPASGTGTTPRPKKITSADVLEAFHRATGRDVIGDYYTRLYGPEALPATSLPLFEALNRTCDALRLRWNRENDFLTFRSASFFNDRLKEVPNRLLERWAMARRSNNDSLPFSDLLEITGLTDAQLDSQTMAEGARVLYGLEEWNSGRAQGLRTHWRFLASFTPGLQRVALSGKGLAFEQMPLSLQQEFVNLTFGRNADPPPTLADLAGATLQVAYQPRVKQDSPPKTPALPANGENAPRREQKPEVTFTYLYGGPNTGQRKKTLTPNSMSMENTDMNKKNAIGTLVPL